MFIKIKNKRFEAFLYGRFGVVGNFGALLSF